MVMPGTSVTVDRPGVFTQKVRADSTMQVDVAGLIGTHYQQGADITDLVQTFGPGAFRVS